MPTEQNKTNARRVYEEVIGRGDLDVVNETIAENLMDHAAPPGMPQGRHGARQWFATLRRAFPDLQVRIEKIIAEGDSVAAHARFTGTHKGEFMGIPPTNRKIDVASVDFMRFTNGQCAEHWGGFDTGVVMQQLGVAPPIGQPPTHKSAQRANPPMGHE